MENKKSKYFKEKGEKQESKYIRQKGEKAPESIYKKSDSDDNKRMSGAARYEQYLERDKARREALEAEENETAEEAVEAVEANETPEPEAAEEKSEQKSEAESKIFTKKSNVEAKPISTADGRNYKKQVMFRTALCCAILEIAAVVLQLLNFRIPLMPLHMRLDLSAIPELLAAVAYGPLAGFAIIVVKNIIYVLIHHLAVTATAVSNIILDTAFVGVASIIYTRGMFSPKKLQRIIESNKIPKDKRAQQIIKSGIIGAIITMPITFLAIRYIVYPMIFSSFGKYGYDTNYYVQLYQNALTSLDSYLPGPLGRIVTEIGTLSRGTLIYNVPITFVKYVFVTLVVALIYRWLSDFLHYRKKIDIPVE